MKVNLPEMEQRKYDTAEAAMVEAVQSMNLMIAKQYLDVMEMIVKRNEKPIRTVLPIGTDIEVYDDFDSPDGNTPVYSGGVEDAYMTLVWGLYPFTDGNWNYLLVVTQDESFAVTTDVTYTGIKLLED